jgi:DNA polymerase-4
VLSAADRMRDKYGEKTNSLGSALRSRFRERTHENPASLPGSGKPDPEQPPPQKRRETEEE